MAEKIYFLQDQGTFLYVNSGSNFHSLRVNFIFRINQMFKTNPITVQVTEYGNTTFD